MRLLSLSGVCMKPSPPFLWSESGAPTEVSEHRGKSQLKAPGQQKFKKIKEHETDIFWYVCSKMPDMNFKTAV